MIKRCFGVGLAILTLSAPALAEMPHQWQCTWTGTWGVQGEEAQEEIKIAGFMFAADGGWVIRANAEERAGSSHLRGACGEGDCWFEQKFPNPAAGLTYFSMKSKEAAYTKDPRVITYTGTWGDAEDASTHKGTIQFSSACKQLKLARPDDIDQLMKKQLGWDDESY
ncbi:MAG: hypothetical protein CVV27_11530 [Candidatus Melainabacteria bacterium HGW-Melainabacteria-1]|nr:MAG: hypothetical protein CVV27_11530 [Candidatus Melainabacteria bacterium HGW-Melainabacteria-1]